VENGHIELLSDDKFYDLVKPIIDEPKSIKTSDQLQG
jgi:hypothetical protein